uniref:Uncharacterized protein n=1 Tax=Rhizophora mucronata TaxID=61149 RepID=A0A2P2PLE2_RHIMU
MQLNHQYPRPQSANPIARVLKCARLAGRNKIQCTPCNITPS